MLTYFAESIARAAASKKGAHSHVSVLGVEELELHALAP